MFRPIVPFRTYSGLQRVVATQHVLWSPARTALRTPCFKIILKHIHFVLEKELLAGEAAKLLQPGRSNKNHFIPKHNRKLFYNCFCREESLTKSLFSNWSTPLQTTNRDEAPIIPIHQSPNISLTTLFLFEIGTKPNLYMPK